MQLLHDLLDWTERYCAGQIQQPEFLAFLAELKGSLTTTRTALYSLKFPEGYAEGAVFLQYSRQGLDDVERSILDLERACLEDDGPAAEQALEQARVALAELEQVVGAARSEKDSRGDGSFFAD
ncbi:MAG: hypothetical protein U0931_14360 [Vulcanimicrobiota bacterium]